MTQALSPAGFLQAMENGTQRTRGRGTLPALALPTAGGCRIAAGWHGCGRQQLGRMQNPSGGSSSDRSGMSSADPGLAVSPKAQQELHARGLQLEGASAACDPESHSPLSFCSSSPHPHLCSSTPSHTCIISSTGLSLSRISRMASIFWVGLSLYHLSYRKGPRK